MFILIIQSYRGHVFTLLKDKVQEEFQKEARSGRIALYQTKLQRVLVGERWESITIIGGKRGGKRPTIQSLKYLIDFLFNYNNGQKQGS
jgi:hypothetical protein